MAHAWGNGIYVTRWLPDLAFGYGYPFFVYREAAPLYAVLLPHLAGLPLPALLAALKAQGNNPKIIKLTGTTGIDGLGALDGNLYLVG